MKLADMTRRDFIQSLSAGTGELLATSALPVFSADRPELFPHRGRWERLSIVSQHIDAGATKPFSVLHISDTHFTSAYPDESEWVRKMAARRVRTFGGRQEEALRDSLSWAKAHVDYVIHTGDMIDFQSRANFDLVRKYCGPAAYMFTGSLGNHELYTGQPKRKERDAFKSETIGSAQEAFPFDVSLQSTVVNGVNIVTLDNSYGTFTERQVTRFKAEVAKGLPIVMCMHCPILTPRIRRAFLRFWSHENLKAIPDVSAWKWSSAHAVTQGFVDYLRSLPLLKGILAGHLHISVADRFSPTAMQYVVGGNFLFHGQEITIS
jgi:hypothetical protein